MLTTGFTYKENDLQTALDTISIKSDGTSSKDSMAAYATYGVGDAIVSGVAGIYNTGVALGESLGAWDDSYRLDEATAIKATFGQNAADFYGRHKEGVDAAGFVLSSVVPGLYAVKAFRAATGYGVLTEGMQVATGMRNAEIYTAARQAALTSPKASLWTNPVIQKAYIAGAKQQFLEAAVFDAAVALTTNQNTFINKDDLGFFEASWKQAVEFAPYTIGFGALAAGVEAFKIKGILSRVIGGELKANSALATPLTESYLGVSPGNALGDIAKRAEKHSTLAPAQEEGLNIRQFKIGQKSIEQTAMEQIGKLNSADQAVGDYVFNAFKKASSGDRGASEAFDNTFAFAENIAHINRQDLNRGINFFTPAEPGKYAPTKSPFGIVEAETPELLQSKMQEYVTQLGAVLPAGTTVSESQFIRLVNKHGANAPQEIKDKLIFQQMANIKSHDTEIKAQLDKLLNAELKTLSHQKISGSSRNKVLSQLLAASQDAAPHLWQGATPKNFKEASEFFGSPIGQKISTAELLSHGGELLTNPATRELAAKKYPELADFLSKQGLADKPWNTTAAYLNMRTGRTSAEILPGVRDIPGVISVDAKGLHHAGLAQSFKYDESIFQVSDQAVGIGALKGEEYLKYDAAWHIAATEKFKGADAEGLLQIGHSDLPRLQRAIVEWEKNPAAMNQILMGFRQFTTPAEARKFYLDEAFVRKVKLTERGLNENVIAKVLHLDVEDLAAVEIPDKLLMATRNYDSPEVVKVAYKSRPARDYNTQAFVYANILALKQGVDEAANSAVLKALGEDTVKLLPEPLPKDIIGRAVGSINPQDGRAGVFGGLTTEVGTLRERAALVFKTMNKQKQESSSQIMQEADFAATALNSKGEEAQFLRAEMVKVDQTLHSGHYALEGKYLIRKEGIQAGEAEMSALSKQLEVGIKERVTEELSALGLSGNKLKKAVRLKQEEISREAQFKATEQLNAKYGEHYLVGAAKALGDREVPHVVELTPKMQKIVEWYKGKQDADWERGRELAKVNGFDGAALPNRYIQPAHVDLNRYKYNAFVVPSVFQAGSDSRKFMIFAESEAEFEAKLAATSNHPIMGQGYKIISTKTDVALYKKMRNEYDGNSLFNTVIFDASQARRGDTSQLVANMDLTTSETFERWHNFAQKRNSAIIDDAIKTRYRDELDTLNRLELAESNFSRDVLNKNVRDSDSIWQDTANLYLGRRSFNAGMDSLYARVNDFVGTKGSAVLDRTFEMVFNKKTPLTEEDYNRYNTRLQQLGYKNPMTDYFGTILTSPDPGVSKSLSTSMRVLSNLHSTFMLRLDAINNAMQIISAPILALPVIREVKNSLQARELDALVTITNPAGGAKQPSAGMLLALSLAEYARPTAQTKEFLVKMKETGILTDYIQEYHLATDFAELNGRHTVKQVDAAIKKIADHGGKWLGFNVAEEATRFMIARSVWEVAKRRGYSLDDALPIIASSVDKVHGVYADATRAGLFRGVVGQGVGLYMTYFFNLMQQFGRGLISNDRKRAGIQAAMQGAIYGIGTMPGIDLLNAQIAKDFEGQDLFSLTGAESGDDFGEFMMYGAASNVWGFNVDMFSRGDLTPRHSTVVPLNPADWAVIGRTASVIGNLVNTAGNVAESIAGGTGPGVAESLMFGLAHNGLSRPLQGVGVLLAGEVTTKSGQVLGESRGFAEDAVFSTMAARLLGSRPTAEGIAMDAMYRKTAYQATVKEKLKSLGQDVQLKLQNGEALSSEEMGGFMKEYQTAGGDLANFNKYWISQMRGFSQPQLQQFRKELTEDTLARKLYYGLQ